MIPLWRFAPSPKGGRRLRCGAALAWRPSHVLRQSHHALAMFGQMKH